LVANGLIFPGGKNIGSFQTNGDRTSASDSDYNTLISRNWNISSLNLVEETTTTTTTEEQTTTTTTTEEQTTTTTTTENITNYSLTFRKLSYNGVEPKKAPLTVSEFEGNFGYLSDYVVHLLIAPTAVYFFP
jgi:hypothetical protein